MTSQVDIASAAPLATTETNLAALLAAGAALLYLGLLYGVGVLVSQKCHHPGGAFLFLKIPGFHSMGCHHRRGNRGAWPSVLQPIRIWSTRSIE